MEWVTLTTVTETNEIRANMSFQKQHVVCFNTYPSGITGFYLAGISDHFLARTEEFNEQVLGIKEEMDDYELGIEE